MNHKSKVATCKVTKKNNLSHRESHVKWSTNVRVDGNGFLIEIETIDYQHFIFHIGSIAVLLFILSVKLLSFLLNKLQGYRMEPNNNRYTNLTNLIFINDLELHASNFNQMRLLLDQIAIFSNEIDISFGESKCEYMIVEKGKDFKTFNNITVKR